MNDELRIIILGSGSPRPTLSRCHPSAIVCWGEGRQLLIDAGDGVVGQLLKAQIPIEQVEHVAFTHMHWDHILGYPAFVWGGWNFGRKKLHVYGPSGTQHMHQTLVEDYYRTQAEWAMELGFSRNGFDAIFVNDVEPGWGIDIQGCRIETGPAHHPPMSAVSYRLTYKGRSLVVTGDTTYDDELAKFSHKADLLVMDACAQKSSATVPESRREILDRLHEFHASPQDCVDLAKYAGIGRVVLTHHLPNVDPEFDDSQYEGDVLVAEDLAEFVV